MADDEEAAPAEAPPEQPSDGQASPKEARVRATRRVRRFVASYTERGPYGFYPEPEVVENVVLGLIDNLVDHGKMYCPCADVADSKAKGHEMVCPCTPHHADIARQGYCDCALFASRDFIATESLRRKTQKSDAPLDASADAGSGPDVGVHESPTE
jgi:ferredoxin-thioredoxin reductase catalytic chain